MAVYTKIKSGVDATQLLGELRQVLPSCMDVRIDGDVNLTITFSTTLTAGEISVMEDKVSRHVKVPKEIDLYVPPSTDASATWVTVVGSIYSARYCDTSLVYTSRWLGLGDGILSSNDQPYILPFTARIIAVTFGSKTCDSNADIEIYRGLGTDGTPVKMVTIPVRGARTYRKTNFATPLIVEAGDTLGVFLASRGTLLTPDFTNCPVVTIHLQCREDSFTEKAVNHARNLSRS
jgi:hypothetical protein